MKIKIIVNNNARNNQLIASYIQALSKENFDFKLLQVPCETLVETIQQAIAEQPDVILIGGGDGTIRSMAKYAINKNIMIGVLPLGTLNHFAKELKLPATPEELILAIKNKSTIKVDIGSVNNEIFVNNVSIGFYTRLAKDRKFYSSFINKWVSYVPAFFSALKHHKKYWFNIDNNGELKQIKTAFLLVSNNLYTFEFPVSFQRECFDKHRLGVYLLDHEKISLKKLWHVISRKTKKFHHMTANNKLEIDVPNMSSINVALDGDIHNINTPLIFQSLPSSLNVLYNTSEKS